MVNLRAAGTAVRPASAPGAERLSLSCLLLLLTLPASLSCAGMQAEFPVSLPASYYACLEARPLDLEIAYFSNYGNRYNASMLYNDRVFVMKDLEWTAAMAQGLASEGCLWLGSVKLVVSNADDCRRFRPGRRVDIVGTNRGILDSYTLLFSDCYVLPAGSLQLPAEGAGGKFVPGY